MSQPEAENLQAPPGDFIADAVPKLCGADVELGNFVMGLDRPTGTCFEASRALLREIPGISDTGSWWSQSSATYAGNRYGPTSPAIPAAVNQGYGYNSGGYNQGYGGGSGYGYNPQDWGRKFLPANGGCVYIDLNHLEVCLPEVLSAYDHVAAWHAMLRIARDAMHQANAKLARGQKIHVLVNNSDGNGNSYGGHVNFLVSRQCWDNIFHRKLHQMLYLASYLASSIVLTGAGKVGGENGTQAVDYQISQRADFYETLTGTQTTYHRPIVNSRNESLCGNPAGFAGQDTCDGDLARLHVIFFDSTLCHVSSLLKVGATQLVLAMLEQEQMVPALILDNPLKALISWSHDPNLHATARTMSGAEYTAVEVQLAILERAQSFVAAGRADGIVPRAQEIISIWQDTLERLRKRDFASLAGKLDWVLKRSMLERAISRQGLQWSSPEIKHLDHVYSSLDANEGLYWACERSGVVEKVVSNGQVERFVHEPPQDTRAWLRAQILRQVDPESINNVDWDAIQFKFHRKGASQWPYQSYYKLWMCNPLGFTRDQCQPVLDQAGSIQEALTFLGGRETNFCGQPTGAAQTTGTSIVVAGPRASVPLTDDELGAAGYDGSGIGPSQET